MTTMSSTKSPQILNPRTTSYEFLGPPGALFVTLAVPFFSYALYFGCSEGTGCPPNLQTIPDRFVVAVSDPAWWKGLWDTQAALIYLAWYMFCVVAWAVLPGDHVEGTTMRNGEKKKYKINGNPTRHLSPSRCF
jgi:Delta14-sterol reductase